MCTKVSREADMRLPRRNHSIATNTIRPPSSMGMGRMLMMARFMLRKPAKASSRRMSPRCATSPDAWAIPIGPASSGAAPPLVHLEISFLNRTIISPVATKDSGSALHGGSARFSTFELSTSTATPAAPSPSGGAKRGVSSTSRSCPPRCNCHSVEFPKLRATARAKSVLFSTSWPAT